MRQIVEGGGISPAGLRRTGGTPNHKALARCVGYGWALATPAELPVPEAPGEVT